MNRGRTQAGLTLVEMIVVVALMGLVVAISFPSVMSGVESVRLNAATDASVAFFNSGLNRAERRQQLTEVVVSLEHNQLEMRSLDPNYFKTLAMPEGITITKIYPEIPGLEEKARSIVLYPGGAIPQFGLELVNRRGVHRIVRVDPMTGVPVVRNPADTPVQ